jgi:hypothetical protein
MKGDMEYGDRDRERREDKGVEEGKGLRSQGSCALKYSPHPIES